jgi:two-component system phosphate regulon sensor histidine kinase PhoR
MSVALVGLLLLQFYWIRNVHELHADEFKSDVEEAVEAAIVDVENFERNIFFSAVDKKDYNPLVRGNKFTLGNVLHNHQSISIHDTIIKENNCQLDYLVISGVTVDSVSGTSAEHRVVTQNYDQLKDFEVEQTTFNSKDSSFIFPIKVGSSFEKNLMVKSKYLNELMLKMFTTNIFDDITLRLNPRSLDTLINNRLKTNKVDTLFNFRVVDNNGEAAKFSSPPNNYQLNIEDPLFRYQLYPSDLVSSQYYVELDFPNIRSYMFKQMLSTLIAALLLVLIVLFAFYFAVSTIFKQKKVSEIKNDFISNMTHELKTPISTISLACEAITDPDIKSDVSTMNSFVGMIASENKRLGNLVEKVLQTSLLEKGKLNLQKANYQINELVEEVVKSFEIQFQQKGGELQLKRLDDVNWSVDKIHFSNVLFNLMDNALKYSINLPIAKIELIKESKGFSLSITDSGIGIKKEDQKRIFNKLYRVSTGDVHDVKGFGLGLDYVSKIVDMHGGRITVKSELGKGATFKITFKNE